jgi:broad specificity phosphatase PhoE
VGHRPTAYEQRIGILAGERPKIQGLGWAIPLYRKGHFVKCIDWLGIDPASIPLSESLKDVTKRTSQFWDEVIVPQIKAKKRILIVGHENNLRSIIKRLDGIADDDIINVELPRAVPLLYKIDPETLKPVAQSDSADYLTGRYLGDKEQLARIAERDYRQVYDLKITETLETVN